MPDGLAEAPAKAAKEDRGRDRSRSGPTREQDPEHRGRPGLAAVPLQRAEGGSSEGIRRTALGIEPPVTALGIELAAAVAEAAEEDKETGEKAAKRAKRNEAKKEKKLVKEAGKKKRKKAKADSGADVVDLEDEEKTSTRRNGQLGSLKQQGWKGGQLKFLQVLVKSVLAVQQSTRDLLSICMIVWSIPTAWPEVEGTKQAGKNYAHTVRTEGRGHLRGPPAPYLFLGFVECLIKRNDDLARRDREQLTLIYQALKAAPVEECCRHVKHFRLQRCYDENWTKVICAVEDLPLAQVHASQVPKQILTIRKQEETEVQHVEEAVLLPQSLPSLTSLRYVLDKTMEQAGARKLLGRAPAGAMEEILQAAVSKD